MDGIVYHNCGDWVESCTALIETRTGAIELVHWVDELRNEEQPRKYAAVI
jgi:UDP-2,3-diacylglucosamine pyrophosphatase LpxH